MKITALVIAFAASALATNKPCAEKAPSAMAAIDKFCSQTKIMVPSDYAKRGQTGYDDSTRVSVSFFSYVSFFSFFFILPIFLPGS